MSLPKVVSVRSKKSTFKSGEEKTLSVSRRVGSMEIPKNKARWRKRHGHSVGVFEMGIEVAEGVEVIVRARTGAQVPHLYTERYKTRLRRKNGTINISKLMDRIDKCLHPKDFEYVVVRPDENAK
jgi:hypothetical protein